MRLERVRRTDELAEGRAPGEQRGREPVGEVPAHELDEPLELGVLRQQERLGARVAQVGALLHATPVGHLLAEGTGTGTPTRAVL